MTKVNNFWQPKVDSLRIRIPIDEVEIISPTFFGKIESYHVETGAKVGESEDTPYKKDTPCGMQFKIWASRRNVREGNYQRIHHYLYFLINSKHLKERYFEGITLNNLDEIRKLINSLGVINVSLETMLNAEFVDVDVCFDFPAPKSEFTAAIKRYYRMARVGKSDNVNQPKTQKTHLGLYLNSRKFSSPSRPYTKFYHKSLELENKSTAFYETYLLGHEPLPDIGRFEFNIRNREYQKYYKMEDVRTMKQLLGFKWKWRSVIRKACQNWFIVRKPKAWAKKKVMWYEIIHHSLHEILDKETMDIIRLNSIANTDNRHQVAKIKNALTMPEKNEEHKDAKRIALVDELDKFLLLKNHTNDVWGNVFKSNTDNDPKEGQEEIEENKDLPY